MARFIAGQFVRQGNQFFRVDNLSNAVAAPDVERAAWFMLEEAFPDVKPTKELLQAVLRVAISV